MAQQGTGAGSYDEFAATAAAYGVGVQRVEPADVGSALTAVIEPPAVGTGFPWDDVSVPGSVTIDPTVAQLEAAVTGVTAATLAIAEYGSIVLGADTAGTEPISLFNDLHVAVVRESDIVADMEMAFEWFGGELRETRGSAIIATGPSATADMGALVQGAHGPKDVEVLVVP